MPLNMKVNRLFGFFSLLVIIIAFLKIVVHLNFWVIPLVFFVVGLAAGLFNRGFSLYLFIFLFPFINSTPALFENGYPYNYMAPSLFLLSGIIIASLLKKIQGTKKEPDIEPVQGVHGLKFQRFKKFGTGFKRFEP